MTNEKIKKVIERIKLSAKYTDEEKGQYIKCIKLYANPNFEVGKIYNLPFAIPLKGYWEVATKEEYDKQEADKTDFDFVLYEKMKERQASKPLVMFEGVDYYEGDMYWWYKFNDLIIKSDRIIGKYTGTFGRASNSDSKIYPSEALCLQGLHEWIWENHKTTGGEIHNIELEWINLMVGNKIAESDWMNYYCEKIIKQKQNG